MFFISSLPAPLPPPSTLTHLFIQYILSTMSLSSLATVELQLIMHHCDLKSLLSLARCCHFALSCASTRFAFQFADFRFSQQCGSLSKYQSVSTLCRRVTS